MGVRPAEESGSKGTQFLYQLQPKGVGRRRSEKTETPSTSRSVTRSSTRSLRQERKALQIHHLAPIIDIRRNFYRIAAHIRVQSISSQNSVLSCYYY